MALSPGSLNGREKALGKLIFCPEIHGVGTLGKMIIVSLPQGYLWSQPTEESSDAKRYSARTPNREVPGRPPADEGHQPDNGDPADYRRRHEATAMMANQPDGVTQSAALDKAAKEAKPESGIGRPRE